MGDLCLRSGKCFAQPRLFVLVAMMPKTQLTWYGQSGFKMVTPGGNVLLIDPWLTNPVFEKGKEELVALKNVDFILVTHGHSDHVGNAVEIGKKTGAKLVATFDLSAAMVTALGYQSELANTETNRPLRRDAQSSGRRSFGDIRAGVARRGRNKGRQFTADLRRQPKWTYRRPSQRPNFLSHRRH
jgi:glyoxylase-like metal-dependent hydrolase (beta-lactamase superfamily II)